MDQIDAGNGLSFRIGFTGHSGHLYIEPSSSAQRHKPLDLLPDYVPPPAFLPETPESIQEYIKEKYLVPRLDPDEFSPQRAGRQWEFDWFDEAKVKPEPSLPRSTIVPRWELPFRRPERWEPKSEQVDISELTNGTEDSGALPGIVGPAKDFVKGSLSSRPFRPGGLDDSHSMGRNIPEGALNGEWVWEMINGGPAQSVPPGLKSGIDFGDLEAHSNSWVVHEDHTAVKTLESVKPNELSVQLDYLFKAWEAEDYAVNDVQAEAKESGAVSEESFDLGAKESISAEDSNAFEIKSAVLDEILAVDSQTTTSTSVEEDLDESGEQQIDGCDASILLDDSSTIQSEQNAVPSLNSIRGLDVIDAAKAQVESICPGIVSCADIIAVAARDASALVQGPTWQVKLGRRDSITANLAQANTDLPRFPENLDVLISKFAAKGFNAREMVVLSGAHTIGQARCVTFRGRIYSKGTESIDAGFASTRRRNCPPVAPNGDSNLAPIDLVTPNQLDNLYFKNLIQNKGLFHSDQVLYNSGSTDDDVLDYSQNPTTFLADFAAAGAPN